ncbi:phycobilisome linker polypeptide CpcG2 [Calothrix sp. NIES-2100]|uniref:phycobilisome rod-core linker polypeptide n=1 Tax=Calothrix sp. NIES-2100 TaxID=1954172 RepID=UPI000B5ED14E|nr:phycobilisome linker polypeptide CpcG2 [Calothrix sp. NIES-2100]
MSIPLLEYTPSSQNQRVTAFEIPGDEQPRIYTTENLLSVTEMDALIVAAYRQIFHEQQMLSSNRQIFLESQLRARQITVRDFIRGLVLSDSFRRLNYDANNNYRFVELCVQRILGRRIYSDKEKLAWSIVLATKGLVSFVQELLNSEEYLSNFGDDTVPYQRRRILPQRSQGELPFERMARYGTDYRDKLPLSMVGYRQPQPFNLETFLRSPNRDLVLLILASGACLIAGLSLLTLFGLFPQIGPY